MDVPSTALEAARTLAAIRRAEIDRVWADLAFESTDPANSRRPTRPEIPHPVDLEAALSSLVDEHPRLTTVRRIVQERRGIDPDAPAVLAAREFRARASSSRRLLASRHARANERPPREVVDGPRVPATRDGATELTRSALTALLTVDALTAWTPTLRASDATRARHEIDVYRTYASDAEAAIPAAFRPWLDDVASVVDAPVEPFPTVPAYVRGSARLGALTERETS